MKSKLKPKTIKSKTAPTAGPASTSEILTPAEVCEILSVSRVSLWRMIHARKIPVIKLSPRITRFRRADILALRSGKA